MADITQKYIKLADQYSESMEDLENFNRLRGLVLGSQTSAHQPRQAYFPVGGDLPATALVGNIGLTAKRTFFGGLPFQFNFPVPIGASFGFASVYNFVIRKILSANVNVSVVPDPVNNVIIFNIFDGLGNFEQIELTGGGSYDIFALIQGLYNAKAKVNKVRVSLPTTDNARLNAWQRDGMRVFSFGWLSKFKDDPVTITRAPGQFNQNVYDSNIPVELSNTEGIAVFVPSLPSNVQPGQSEATDITLYFGSIAKL